ncbi:MAG: site-2 protease family protein [Pirellulaceae bacterium]
MEFCLIADSSTGGVLTLCWTILKVAGGLGFVIFVHELGHFLVAKACGVKCEKFYVGFDVPIRIGPLKLPSTICKFQRGETEYGIGIIPLGGYVKMLGQDDNPANYQKEADRIRLASDTDDDAEVSETPAESSEGSSADATAVVENAGPVELDPRSYPAKKVWQRMAIISAGVIMNLIFAVIFAAVAYRIGVKYTPCVVGGVSTGSPAWENGWEAGDQIIGIGDQAKNDHLRFQWDLAEKVFMSAGGKTVKPLKLTLRLKNGQERTDEMTASTELKEQFGRVSIGVRPTASTVLSASLPVWKHRVAGQTDKPLQGGDRIIAVDGETLEQDPQTNDYWVHDLIRKLAGKIDKGVVLSVERQAGEGSQEKQRLEISLPPARMMQVGLFMEMGPITAIRKGSPAARWKLKPGDVLLEINGLAVEDPLTVPQQLVAFKGQKVEFKFQRKADSEPLVFEVDSLRLEDFHPYMAPGAKMGLESIGIAYEVRSLVRDVLPGSPAAKAGMQAGDEVLQVQFKYVPATKESDDQQAENENFQGQLGYAAPLDLETTPISWLDVHHSLQTALPATELTVSYRRANNLQTATLVGVESEKWFFPIRGLVFVPTERINQSESLVAAFGLGFRETREKLAGVGKVLKMLFTREIPMKSLGGPVIIAKIAGGEAAQGLPRLLIFLTFLSANLAVLNFLPIPALDGGHMVFLLVEGVTGKPVNEQVQGALTLVGVACLLSLMIFVLGNDIFRVFF